MEIIQIFVWKNQNRTSFFMASSGSHDFLGMPTNRLKLSGIAAAKQTIHYRWFCATHFPKTNAAAVCLMSGTLLVTTRDQRSTPNSLTFHGCWLEQRRFLRSLLFVLLRIPTKIIDQSTVPILSNVLSSESQTDYRTWFHPCNPQPVFLSCSPLGLRPRGTRFLLQKWSNFRAPSALISTFILTFLGFSLFMSCSFVSSQAIPSFSLANASRKCHPFSSPFIRSLATEKRMGGMEMKRD